MKISRLTKYQAFEKFFESSKELFEAISAKDKRSSVLTDLYPLCITPGGRNGGQDKRQVEVFFGSRPFDDENYRYDRPQGFPQFGNRLITETGASLSYSRTDSGDVLCMLSPAKSKYFTHKEDLVLYKIIKKPCCDLSDVIVIKGHWNDFISYMHCTSLDGDPSIIDRLKVFWFRFTKTLIINDKEVSPQIYTSLKKIVGFSLTVGLSGFLLLLIDNYIK